MTVTGVDDTIIDGNVAYSIVTAEASSTDSNYHGLNPADVSVVNLDDDASEAFLIGPADWTAAGLTVTLGSDGKLHAYRTGTTIDAVPPHVFANVTGIQITGRSDADDELTVDFGAGNPIPAGGMVFDGGTQLGGDTLLIKGTAGRRQRHPH